jgi:hypothetical protein
MAELWPLFTVGADAQPAISAVDANAAAQRWNMDLTERRENIMKPHE